MNSWLFRINLHLITLQKRWLPRGVEDPFLKALPTVILHPYPSSNPEVIIQTIDKMCPCPDMCHEYEYGLLHTHQDQVRHIFETALNSYWTLLKNKSYLKPKVSKYSTVIGNYSYM